MPRPSSFQMIATAIIAGVAVNLILRQFEKHWDAIDAETEATITEQPDARFFTIPGSVW